MTLDKNGSYDRHMSYNIVASSIIINILLFAATDAVTDAIMLVIVIVVPWNSVFT